MDILESVDPSEIPEGGRRAVTGVWTGLAKRAIADYEQGRVTVVVLADQAEYRKMMNGTIDIFRKAGYSRTPTVVRNADSTLRVFLQLVRRPQPTNNHPRRPAASGIRPVRRG